MRGAIRKLHRSESGQSAVLVAMLSGVLIFIIAMATNVGKLVTEKIALQNAVDLAVYSGAATQAKYLNRMQDKNKRIRSLIENKRQVFEGLSRIIPVGLGTITLIPGDITLVPGCNVLPNGNPSSAVNTEIQLFQLALNGIGVALNADNMLGNMRARQAAVRAANANYSGAGAKLQPKFLNPTKMVELEQATVDVSYRTWCNPCPPPSIPCPRASTFVVNHRLNAWWFKDDGGDVMFAAGIENARPNSPFLDAGGRYFSDSCGGRRCPMSVFAAAKPFYGKLAPIPSVPNERYTDVNADHFQNNVFARDVDRAQQIRSVWTEGGRAKFRPYKVRFIGLNDPSANSVRPYSGLQINRAPGIAPYGGKMRH